MTRLLFIGAAALLAAGCDGERSPAPEHPPQTAPPWSDAWIVAEGTRYLDDPAFRRAALEASLTDPSNVYSATRLSAYGKQTQGWDALPVWSPRVAPVDAAMTGSLARGEPIAMPSSAKSLWTGTRPESFDDWAALGRAVFYLYPLRPEVQAAYALADPAVAESVGLAPLNDGTWPGVVAFEDVDGEAKIGITCALCHVSVEAGVAVEGRARRDFDYGRMRLAWHEGTGAPVTDDLAARMRSWGPGRADITQDDDEDPVAIVDLWDVRSLRHLTQAATLTHEHPAALAIRQETQILHANDERTRPPRELAFALAIYVYSLQTPPPTAAPSDASARGQAVFDDACAGCHEGPTGAGTPRPAKRIGTEPTLAFGKARGTGLYRPSPLIRVADAAPYLHDGSVGSLEALLGRERLEDDYQGPRGVGAVDGHRYGLGLEDDDRADLIAYLRTR
ncbi:MAG: c-type cytochrome [Myxococcota bacterium]